MILYTGNIMRTLESTHESRKTDGVEKCGQMVWNGRFDVVNNAHHTYNNDTYKASAMVINRAQDLKGGKLEIFLCNSPAERAFADIPFYVPA